MATDEQINDAIQGYLTELVETAYPNMDGLLIAAEAGWKMLREENAALRGQVAMLRDASQAFLTAWGTIHEHPDWVDPSVMRYSPIAVGIPVEVALQARTALATDPVVRLSGSNKSHGEGVIEAARAIVGRMPQRPSPHGPRPAVMDESAPFAALWDAVQALDAPT
jgi:hypothetical protein